MAEIQNISIELVKVHPNNVRKTYNDIEELAESIKAKGILQNLTVVPDPQEPGKYLTVIGNRRLTAARVAVHDTDEKICMLLKPTGKYCGVTTAYKNKVTAEICPIVK